MTVNAWPQDNSPIPDEQASVSLVELDTKGRLIIHPELVRQIAPGLLSGLFGNPANTPKPANVSQFPARASNNSSEFKALHSDPYADEKRRNYKRGRLWASIVRKIMARTNASRYEAYKELAEEIGVPVTDVRLLVELSNKETRCRGTAIRRAILWKWHCEGMTHRAVAQRFPFPIHEKTVASEIAEIKKQLHGGSQNVQRCQLS